MLNNAVLDIAIALVLMYLVLSLMGTVINEFISTAINLRSKTLKSALEKLLDNPDLRKAFYDHGLIDGANKATGGHPSYLSGDTFASALIGSLSDKPLPSFDDVRTAIGRLNDSNIRDALLSQLTKSGDSLDKLREEIGNFYDASMDRVSGIYKRYLKWISLAVGVVVVVALNADSVKVGAALWKDSTLRAQMVATAQSVVARGAPDTTSKPVDFDALKKQLNSLENDLRPLPVGLTSDALSRFKSAAMWSWLVTQPGLWWLLTKLVGLTITAFAISLGAPFWFDTLSKLTNIRGTGNKPKSTTSSSS